MIKLSNLLPVLFAGLFLLSQCSPKKQDQNISVSKEISNHDTARILKPGLISTFMNERDFTMTPAMDQLFFTVNEGKAYAIVTMKKQDNGWSAPQLVSFNSPYHDIEPFVAPDGNTLYFASNRPEKNNGKAGDFDIWLVKKTPHGWSDPENLGEPVNTPENEFYPSVTSDGHLYFTTHHDNIAVARWKNGVFQVPQLLPDSINTSQGEYNAFIDPDEKYLLFSSYGWPQKYGQGDIFISWKKNNGGWTTPRCLDGRVNSAAIDMCPYVSPDGKYLFFSSRKKVKDLPMIKTYGDLKKIAQRPGNGSLDLYKVTTEGLF